MTLVRPSFRGWPIMYVGNPIVLPRQQHARKGADQLGGYRLSCMYFHTLTFIFCTTSLLSHLLDRTSTCMFHTGLCSQCLLRCYRLPCCFFSFDATLMRAMLLCTDWSASSTSCRSSASAKLDDDALLLLSAGVSPVRDLARIDDGKTYL